MAHSILGPAVSYRPKDWGLNATASVLREVPRLPTGFPDSFNSPMVWTGATFADNNDFTLSLDDDEICELENALKLFKGLGLDGDLVTQENFTLPTLSLRLATLRREIYCGRGFGVVRGLNPQKYSVEDLTILYLGIQVHIANRFGRQDIKGNMLVHIVADSSSVMKASHHRHSTAPIAFHSEETGDIVSWLTKSTSQSGGRCVIASMYTVYNVLAVSRPDLIRTLSRSDWPFALPKFHCRAILFHHNDRLITNFGRAALLGSMSHPRPTGLPKLTDSQLEALDAVEKIAKATQLSIRTQPGDMHFINNLAVLHSREGYVNGQDAHDRRHLVRMRLRDDELGWSIPPALKNEWEKAFQHGCGKIWHIEPMPDGFFPLRSHPN